MLLFVIEAGLEAPSLLVFGDVEIELEDEDVVVGEVAFELVDVVEATVRDFAGDELVDARGENVFVVGTVEDADHAARRDLGVDAPEEVVAGFEGGGHFEGGDVAALRINSGEDMADGAVFAGGVHALEDDEQGLGLAGVEEVLPVSELGAVFDQHRLGLLLRLEVAGVGGRYFREPNFGVRLDEMRRLDLHETVAVQSRGYVDGGVKTGRPGLLD
jgi:hypothetical protein